jgi:uroporphyrinogen III methyltransferase/synthase
VLFPRAAAGRDVIPDEMRRIGATLDLVTVYRTVPSPAGRERLRGLLAAGTLDAVTFTSGSTVKSFVSLLIRADRTIGGRSLSPALAR